MPPPKKGRRRTNPLLLSEEMRRQEAAYQLKMANHTYQEIANSPHPDDPSKPLYSDSRAAQRGYLTARNRHIGADDTASMREEWKMRNEAVFKVLWPQVMSGDQWAIDRYTRLLKEHVAMLGLNAPVRSEVTVLTESTVDAAIRELQEELKYQSRAAGVEVPEIAG